ncbi:hypothetical protein G9444_1895 [Rhodococcus erythropolis]|uniref:Uncharacterized protein n=1 Tax=Rhodococcus erythropolis TaxID=1833 RepID=A0A6G9CQG6_RHOER|nr:hypothetical protein G9444_1895 [Rhodococcus erythropolis]
MITDALGVAGLAVSHEDEGAVVGHAFTVSALCPSVRLLWMVRTLKEVFDGR